VRPRGGEGVVLYFFKWHSCDDDDDDDDYNDVDDYFIFGLFPRWVFRQ